MMKSRSARHQEKIIFQTYFIDAPCSFIQFFDLTLSPCVSHLFLSKLNITVCIAPSSLLCLYFLSSFCFCSPIISSRLNYFILFWGGGGSIKRSTSALALSQCYLHHFVCFSVQMGQQRRFHHKTTAAYRHHRHPKFGVFFSLFARFGLILWGVYVHPHRFSMFHFFLLLLKLKPIPDIIILFACLFVCCAYWSNARAHTRRTLIR